MSDLVSKVWWLYKTERARERKPLEKVLRVGSFRYSTGLQTQTAAMLTKTGFITGFSILIDKSQKRERKKAVEKVLGVGSFR